MSMKKSSKLAAQITEYGTPPDLSEHMPLFETAPDQDEIIDAWNKRRSHRKVSIEELDEIEFAHERINSIMSQNSIRLSEAQKGISRYNIDIQESETSLNVENEKAYGKRVSRRSSIKAMMTRNRRSVMMVTACTQTLIQGLDMDIIRMTSDQLTTCQEAQDFMIQHFGQLKDKWLVISGYTKQLQCDYNKVVSEACSTCALFQQELHALTGQVAALQSQLEHSLSEKDGLRSQLADSTKAQSILRMETEGAITREETALNKIAFMEDENIYMRKEVESAREHSRLLHVEYRKLEEDREQLVADFVESRLKQSEVVAKYLDELQEREEERRDFLRATDSSTRTEKLLRDTDRQAKLTEERNNLAEEVDLLNAKCTAQELHIEDLQRQLSDLAKVVDAYASYNVSSSMTEVMRAPLAAQASNSYMRALTSHKSGTGTGAINRHSSSNIATRGVTGNSSSQEPKQGSSSKNTEHETVHKKSILKRKTTKK